MTTIRIGLLVRTEFLRLVLRLIVRRQVGVEIVGEGEVLADAARLAPATLLIVERAVCPAGPDVLALLDRHPAAQVILIGPGNPLAGVPADRLQYLTVGGAEGGIDPAVLAPRLTALIHGRRAAPSFVPPEPRPAPDAPPRLGLRHRPAVIGVAASTGGPEALQDLLRALDPPPCPIVIALHIPAAHAPGLVGHLADTTGHRVVLGETGLGVTPGIFILEGGADHAVVADGPGLRLQRVRGGTSVFHPNGDILLTSLARLGRPAAGVILTGMGQDGTIGARAMADAGFPVLAQRPATCAVPGMPAAAIAAGAVSDTAAPADLARRLNGWFRLAVV